MIIKEVIVILADYNYYYICWCSVYRYYVVNKIYWYYITIKILGYIPDDSSINILNPSKFYNVQYY